MRQLIICLSLALVVLLGLVATMGRIANAQESTPTVMADHPVVGGWHWENDMGDGTSLFTYAAFHPDGTYVESFGADGTDIGVWKPTGPRTADLTLYSADVDPDPDVTVPVVSRLAIAVDETGNAIAAEGTYQGLGEDGAVLFSGPGIAQGTRLEVLPVIPPGTPAAATPAA
jgi:hypothetical protein